MLCNTNRKGIIVKKTFDGWNMGGKMIFIATVVGILSLFMKWVDVGIVSASGFQQQGYLILVLYIYPMVQLFKTKPINKAIGIVSGILAIIAGVAFLISKNVEFMGESVNVASTGLYIFVLSAVLLTAGIVKYEE